MALRGLSPALPVTTRSLREADAARTSTSHWELRAFWSMSRSGIPVPCPMCLLPVGRISRCASKPRKPRRPITRQPPAQLSSPFAIETFGGIGKEACAFIKQVLKLAGDLAYVWAPKELVYGLPQAVAVAVQRGNAKAVADCLSSAAE